MPHYVPPTMLGFLIPVNINYYEDHPNVSKELYFPVEGLLMLLQGYYSYYYVDI